MQGDSASAKAIHNLWRRFYCFVRSKKEERLTQRVGETTADKAARTTAAATKWMAIFTFLLFIVSALTLIILRNQLKEMHEGGIDTHALATSAGDQATAAKNFATSAGNINSGIDGAVIKMQAAVDQLGGQVTELSKNARESTRLAIAAEQTARATQDGLNTNRNALQLENRAWLGVTNESVIQFETGKAVKVDINLVNSGKTPASQVDEGTDLAAYSVIPSMPIIFGLKPTASIPPQGVHVLHFVSSVKLDGVTEAKVEAKQLIWVFRGTVQYEDFDKMRRATYVCMFMSDPPTKQLSFCPDGNDMD